MSVGFIAYPFQKFFAQFRPQPGKARLDRLFGRAKTLRELTACDPVGVFPVQQLSLARIETRDFTSQKLAQPVRFTRSVPGWDLGVLAKALEKSEVAHFLSSLIGAR